MDVKRARVLVTLALLVAPAAALEGLPEPGITPDSPVYGLKRVFEQVFTPFTHWGRARHQRSLELAERRLAETVAMTERNRTGLAERASRDYSEQAGVAVRQAMSHGGARELEAVSNRTLDHIRIMQEVIGGVPGQSRRGVEGALKNAVKVNRQAILALAHEDTLRAARRTMEAAGLFAAEVLENANGTRPRDTRESAEMFYGYLELGRNVSSLARGREKGAVEQLLANETGRHLDRLRGAATFALLPNP